MDLHGSASIAQQSCESKGLICCWPLLTFTTLRGNLARELGVRRGQFVFPGGNAKRLLSNMTMNIDRGNALSIQCRGCHIMEKSSQTKVGPSLWNLLGPDKGSIAGYEYSSALKAAGGKWTYEELNKWIAHPAWEIPGAAMTIAPIANASDRADLVGCLRTLSDEPVPLP